MGFEPRPSGIGSDRSTNWASHNHCPLSVFYLSLSVCFISDSLSYRKRVVQAGRLVDEATPLLVDQVGENDDSFSNGVDHLRRVLLWRVDAT